MLFRSRKRRGFDPLAALLRPRLLADRVARDGQRLMQLSDRATAASARRIERAQDRADALAARLEPALGRMIAQAGKAVEKGQGDLAVLTARLDAAPAARLAALANRLDALDRTRQTLGYAETLKRGYAVLRGDGVVVTTRVQAEKAAVLEAEFQDGKLLLAGKAKKSKDAGGAQATLFD